MVYDSIFNASEGFYKYQVNAQQLSYRYIFKTVKNQYKTPPQIFNPK